MIVIWIIIALCGICSLILLSGRGSILIAGYNTMSKEEQEQYDEKKLCRITGAGMLVITVLTVVLETFGEKIPDWFWTLYAVLVIFIAVGIMILSNTICKIKENTGSKKKSYNKVVICRQAKEYCAVSFFFRASCMRAQGIPPCSCSLSSQPLRQGSGFL